MSESSLPSSERICVVSVGACSMQGRRRTMEDTLVVVRHPHLSESVSSELFAIFDGHAGEGCSAFCRDHIVKNVVEAKAWKYPVSVDNSNSILTEALERIDEEFCSTTLPSDGSGSTALVVLLRDNLLTVGNIGDCRAIIGFEGGCVALTVDHKPNDPVERERVLKNGGFVGRNLKEAKLLSSSKCFKCFPCLWPVYKLKGYPYRVYPGGLAISRTVGDVKMRVDGLVFAKPQISHRVLGNTDEFVLLACDGLWDVLSNEEVARLVRQFKKEEKRPREICKSIAKAAYDRGGEDNITIILLLLSSH